MPPWRIAYMEALFENDRRKIGPQIARAMDLMLQRERDLQADSDNAELQAINRGLHALHALRICLSLQAEGTNRVEG